MAVKGPANSLPVHHCGSRFLPGRSGNTPNAQSPGTRQAFQPAALRRQRSSRCLHGSTPRLSPGKASLSRLRSPWANGVQSWLPWERWIQASNKHEVLKPPPTLKYCWPVWQVPVPFLRLPLSPVNSEDRHEKSTPKNCHRVSDKALERVLSSECSFPDQNITATWLLRHWSHQDKGVSSAASCLSC